MVDDELTREYMKAIIELAKQGKRPDGALWSISDIAAYLGFTRSHVDTSMKNQRGFPRPIRLPNRNGEPSNKRWKPSEVKTWVERHRDKTQTFWVGMYPASAFLSIREAINAILKQSNAP